MEKVLWQVTPTLPAFCLVGHPCCRGLGLLTAGKISGASCWEQLWHTQPWGQESQMGEGTPSVPHSCCPRHKAACPSLCALTGTHFIRDLPEVVEIALKSCCECCAELCGQEDEAHSPSILHRAVLFLASCLFWADPAVHTHASTPARMHFIATQPKLHPLQDTTKSSLIPKPQVQGDPG